MPATNYSTTVEPEAYKVTGTDPTTTQQTTIAPTTTATIPTNQVAPATTSTSTSDDSTRQLIVQPTNPDNIPIMNFVPEQMFVENRINGLLQQDNPYIQQARQRALQAAASRGMQNSTMALQAGEAAAISQALPIAQADAATAYDTAKSQYQMGGQFSLSQQDFRNQQALQERELQAQLDLARGAEEQQLEMERLQHQNRLEQIGAERVAERSKMELGSSLEQIKLNKQLTQQMQLHYAETQRVNQTNYSAEVQAIQQSTMHPTDKNKAIEDARARYESNSAWLANLYAATAADGSTNIGALNPGTVQTVFPMKGVVDYGVNPPVTGQPVGGGYYVG